MHELSSLLPAITSQVQRRGRGTGSGRGKTSQRGHKGSKARSGHQRRHYHEGGAIPLYRRLPKRGGKKSRTKPCIALTLRQLAKVFTSNDKVDIEMLKRKQLIPHSFRGFVKVIGSGNTPQLASLRVDRFSESAKITLEKANIKWQER